MPRSGNKQQVQQALPARTDQFSWDNDWMASGFGSNQPQPQGNPVPAQVVQTSNYAARMGYFARWGAGFENYLADHKARRSLGKLGFAFVTGQTIENLDDYLPLGITQVDGMGPVILGALIGLKIIWDIGSHRPPKQKKR
jgi:hypothetical protein